MQVSYKTISSYEYDAISGQYKQVDKQVEDYSSTSDSDFMDILSKLEENSGISSTEENFYKTIPKVQILIPLNTHKCQACMLIVLGKTRANFL